MPVIKQTIEKIVIDQLKGLHNVEISFSDKPITAIFGVNGCGKSTILHALACLYKTESNIGETNYFTRFFKRENGVSWAGGKLWAHFKIENSIVKKKYAKVADRWTPRIDQRPKRDVVYLGISSCVPDIEQVTITLTSFAMGADEIVQKKDNIIQAGIVTTQAVTIFPTILHFTACA